MQKQNKKKMLTSFSCTSKTQKKNQKKKRKQKSANLEQETEAKTSHEAKTTKTTDERGNCPEAQIRKKERDPPKRKKNLKICAIFELL
jgi:hypothetical protein